MLHPPLQLGIIEDTTHCIIRVLETPAIEAAKILRSAFLA